MISGIKKLCADVIVTALQGIRMFFLVPRGACRFEPTCSVYTHQALRFYPPHIAIIKITWRLLRCNPFFKGGYDPVCAEKNSIQ